MSGRNEVIEGGNETDTEDMELSESINEGFAGRCHFIS